VELKKLVGCGVIDFTLATQLGERTSHAIELLGEKIAPRMKEI
jgi:hypothetical protein